jgi:hypothetical protein
MVYPAQDVEILRRLAEQVRAIAARPVNGQRAAMWTQFNGLRPGRPMVLIVPGGSQREFLPDERLQGRDPFCRGLEGDLRRVSVSPWVKVEWVRIARDEAERFGS